MYFIKKSRFGEPVRALKTARVRRKLREVCDKFKKVRNEGRQAMVRYAILRVRNKLARAGHCDFFSLRMHLVLLADCGCEYLPPVS